MIESGGWPNTYQASGVKRARLPNDTGRGARRVKKGVQRASASSD